MKINKVILKDFRIHQEAEFGFDEGINLIIGKNGSGKSSILEAIGLALFDADIRSSLQEAIRLGNKLATIKIEFEGNDGNIYIVERKLGNISSYKLTKCGEAYARLEGKEIVINKIKELAGIPINEKNLFQNVISAYQNKFIATFEERPAIREKIFNQIFDTAIYREMYENSLKIAHDSYQTKLYSSQENLSLLQAKLKNSNELKKNISILILEKNSEESKLAKIKKILLSKEKKCENLRNIKSKIDQIMNSIKHLSEIIDMQSKQLAKTKTAHNESIEAKSIILKNKQSYTEYIEKNRKLQILLTKIDKLEKLEKSLNENNNKLSQALIKQKELSTKKEQFENQLKEKSEQLESRLNIMQQQQEAYESLEKEYSYITNLTNYFESLFNKITNLYNELTDKIRKVDNLETELNIVQSNIIPQHEIEALLAQKNQQLESLNKLATNFREINNLINQINANIDINEKARSQLINGICPFLNEECLNLKTKSAKNDYLKDKTMQLICKREELLQQLQNYSSIDKEISQLNVEIAQLSDKEKSNLINQKKQEEINCTKNAIMHQISSLEKKIFNLVTSEQNKINLDIKNKSLEQIHKLLQNYFISLKEKRQSILSSRNEKFNTLNSSIREKEDLESKIKNIQSNIQKTINEYTKNEYLIESLKKTINEIDQTIVELPQLKKTRTKLNEELQNLKPNYDLYSMNIKKAKEVNKYSKEIIKITKKISESEEKQNKLREKLIKLQNLYSDYEYEKERNELENKKMEKENIEKKIYQFDSQIKIVQKELDENIQLEKECKEFKEKIYTLEKKLQLLNIFRDKVGSMGKFVAVRLLEHIENVATCNYREITGNNESIKWINDEKESYSVYLTNLSLNQWRRFELLSGGEQVIVALSLRAAMATVLTKSKIIIFDEPTINLDHERKYALASALKQMMKDLQQAIIVTHDDTFQEMAQKIILC